MQCRLTFDLAVFTGEIIPDHCYSSSRGSSSSSTDSLASWSSKETSGHNTSGGHNSAHSGGGHSSSGGKEMLGHISGDMVVRGPNGQDPITRPQPLGRKFCVLLYFCVLLNSC